MIKKDIKKVSPIVEFYNNKVIFVTGTTGFLGMCILQKLLYECEEIKSIYVLIKSKHGKTVEERLQQILSNSAFDRIREKNCESLKKVKAVDGDLKLKGLGISDENIQTLQSDVSVVLHVAATINIKLPLAEAINTNTKGTEQLVKICKNMKQLTAFVYVSTAYCNSNRPTIEEKVYKSIPLEVMYYVSDIMKDVLEKNALVGKPNTYAVSKSLAEELIENELKNVAIVRPSIITTASKDPEPGWIYRWSGAIQSITVMGNGAAKCWHVDPDGICDVIPVDMVANLTIASAWDVYMRSITTPNIRDAKVYQCCSGLQNPITSRELLKTYEYYGKKHLSQKGYFPFGLILVKKKLLHSIIFMLLQTIPAYICTIFEYIFFQTTRILQTHHLVRLLGDIFNFFNMNQFLFIDYNVRQLYDKMDEADQEIFCFDVKKLNWERYIQDFVLGVKKHLLKEN